MEFFNNIIKGLEVILVLYFSLTLNVPLNQDAKARYYLFVHYIGKSVLGGECKIEYRVTGAVTDSWEGVTTDYYYYTQKEYTTLGEIKIECWSYDAVHGDVTRHDFKTFPGKAGETYVFQIEYNLDINK